MAITYFVEIIVCRKFHKNHKDETIEDLRRQKLDVVVTTYETCRDHISTLNEFTWEAVIADEAHKIKVSIEHVSCRARM